MSDRFNADPYQRNVQAATKRLTLDWAFFYQRDVAALLQVIQDHEQELEKSRQHAERTDYLAHPDVSSRGGRATRDKYAENPGGKAGAAVTHAKAEQHPGGKHAYFSEQGKKGGQRLREIIARGKAIEAARRAAEPDPNAEPDWGTI